MKWSRKKLFVIAGVGCFGLAVLLLSLPSKEPTYQGRRVSQWLEQHGFLHDDSVVAMEHFGTNAIPAMLQWINYQPPRYWHATNFWVRTMKKVPFVESSITRREYRALGALHNFQRLGPRAEAAIPDLNRMVLNLKSNQIQLPLFALTYLGTNAIPAMIAALTNKNIRDRQIITEAFFGLGPAARPALPVLIECLKDPDPAVRMGSCNALGRMQADYVRVVPRLMEAVADPHPDVRFRALYALSRFGTNARPAAPVVLKALNDPVGNVHNWATNTLRFIAPELVPQTNP